MLIRDVYQVLEDAMEVKQIITITGMRRVGKTTAVKYLSEKIAGTNKLYFDLEQVENRLLFRQENYQQIVKDLELLGLDFSVKAFVMIDEIQLVPEITSVVKYLYDTYDIKFIITGSSSFYLKNHFSESLAGRKRIIELHPLSFTEFLRFREAGMRLPEEPFGSFNEQSYLRLLPYYLDYMKFGGFPEVVLANKESDKIALLKDIINSYLSLDIKFLADFSKADDVYKIIKMLSLRAGNRIDYTKISGISGMNRQLIKEYLLFFEQTYLIRQVPAFVKSPDREIALQKKLYFTDNGILSILGNTSSGALLENTVANQLALHGNIQYYTRRDGREIDFILNEDIAVEVKETPGTHDLRTLNNRALSLGITKTMLVGLYHGNPAFSDFIWAGSV